MVHIESIRLTLVTKSTVIVTGRKEMIGQRSYVHEQNHPSYAKGLSTVGSTWFVHGQSISLGSHMVIVIRVGTQ